MSASRGLDPLGGDKISGARRQLDAAIVQLFDGGDAAAIHTIVSAVRNVLQDLSERKQTKYWIALNSDFSREGKAKFWKALNKSGNFLKHADSDPEGVFPEVDARINDHLIHICIGLYEGLGHPATRTMGKFQAWYAIVYRDLFPENSPQRAAGAMGAAILPQLVGRTREDQLREGKALIAPARLTLRERALTAIRYARALLDMVLRRRWSRRSPR
jgi:hypothetical protein